MIRKVGGNYTALLSKKRLLVRLAKLAFVGVLNQFVDSPAYPTQY